MLGNTVKHSIVGKTVKHSILGNTVKHSMLSDTIKHSMLDNTVKHSIDNRKNIVNSLLKIIDITSFNFQLAIYEQI